MSGDCGVSALVKCALHFEELGAVTLNIGREPLASEDSCTLQSAARHLLYVVLLNRAGANLAAQPLDAAGAPETLVRLPDDAQGWDVLRRLVDALETNEIKTLHPRPLEVGPIGPNGWIIA
jgi:hypothetical protein